MPDANAKSFIVDASFVLSFLLPDENNSDVVAHFKDFLAGKVNFISNFLLPFEVCNSLQVAVNRKRLSKQLALQISEVLQRYRINLQPVNPRKVLSLAQKHNLTFYDASYLYLAQSENLPILTMDKHLIPFSL